MEIEDKLATGIIVVLLGFWLIFVVREAVQNLEPVL